MTLVHVGVRNTNAILNAGGWGVVILPSFLTILTSFLPICERAIVKFQVHFLF